MNDIETKPINDVKVHVKLESLLKDETKIIKNWKQQEARIIVWQRYAVSAIFSPIFMKAKARLKELLDENTVYTDGYRPDELSARLRLINNAKGFYENDLTKQDR